ncbi:MAG: NAD(P)/FAD-dependent oxidoreductase [Gemmatimonadetes bacterium]|nr:NAD(P)/FAD-dependent oxidoreductase [Gemmatimonadota bacterium]
MSDDIRDITIIGGGPTGLFGAFYAGVRQASCRIIDSLPELGGQLTALYPGKDIYDVGGFPRILAKDLANNLIEQGTQFGCDVVLDEDVRTVEREGDAFRLVGRARSYLTRTILIAGGKGAFEPRHLEVPGYLDLLHKGVVYAVKDPESYRDKKVIIVGGGDSALDWALILKDKCSAVTLIHRREGFRAHEASVVALEQACESGRISLRTYHEVRAIHGNGAVDGITIYDNRTDEDTRLEVDAVLCFLGFKPDLGPIKSWGLTVNKNRIVVNHLMETNISGIYGAGDVVEYEGKIELIVTGFAEATIAVNNAVHFVDPKARVNPGHSTNLAIFKDK